MTKVNFELKGADKIIKKLSKISKQAYIDVDGATLNTASEIVKDAKILAPKDTGKLAQSIAYQKLGNEIAYRIYAGAKYAPYMEFGTGGLVNVPTELKDLAIRFKGKGIRKINLMPQPFMYPSYVVNKQYYIEDLKSLLKKYGKDFT